MTFPKNHKKINFQLLNVDIYAFRDRKPFSKACKYVGIDEIDLNDTFGRTRILLDENGNRMIYVGVFNEDPGVAVHEITHAALFMLSEFGIDPASSNGEVCCYTTQFLFNELIEYFTKMELFYGEDEAEK